MSDSLENQQFTRWLRRPTIFIANSWYLFAAAGQTIVGYAVTLAAQLLGLFGLSFSGTGISSAASAIYELVVLALPVVWYAARHEGVGQSMRLNPPNPNMLALSAITALIGVLAVNCLSTWWLLLIESLGGRLYSSGVPVPTTPDELRRSILLVGVIPGICEELFFRGGLMGAWERRGTKQALVLTSLLFALLHGSIFGLPTQLIMGFVLGYVLILSDSLYVSMVYHTVHNSTILILSYAAAGAETEAALSMAAQMGGLPGYIALFIRTLICGGMFIALLFGMRCLQLNKGHNPEKITFGDTEPMTWQELVVMIAGLVTVSVAYITDLLTICGIL